MEHISPGPLCALFKLSRKIRYRVLYTRVRLLACGAQLARPVMCPHSKIPSSGPDMQTVPQKCDAKRIPCGRNKTTSAYIQSSCEGAPDDNRSSEIRRTTLTVRQTWRPTSIRDTHFSIQSWEMLPDNVLPARARGFSVRNHRLLINTLIRRPVAHGGGFRA